MKTREITLANGEKFTVPQGVQRLDSRGTRGWQVRYQGTKYFADGTTGADKSLKAATKELLQRIATMPAPVAIKREPSPRKTSNLPAGISGPIVLNKRDGASSSAVLAVLVPRYGQGSQLKKVHIGTPNTYTKKRYREALARAIEIRSAAVALYQEAATKAKRKAANVLKKELAAGR
jgi:hypothetical protein